MKPFFKVVGTLIAVATNWSDINDNGFGSCRNASVSSCDVKKRLGDTAVMILMSVIMKIFVNYSRYFDCYCWYINDNVVVWPSLVCSFGPISWSPDLHWKYWKVYIQEHWLLCLTWPLLARLKNNVSS